MTTSGDVTDDESGVRRIVLLDNPAAGRGAAIKIADVVAQRLHAAGLDVERMTSSQGNDLQTRLQSALGASTTARTDSAVVVVGGDGTVNRALSAVAGTRTPLGIIPAGTGNDIATELGLPLHPEIATTRLIAACHNGSWRSVDAVRWNQDHGASGWYVSVLGMGFDSLVNERANSWSWPRGRRRYDLAVLRELAAFRPRPFVLTLDGATTTVEAVLIAVGNLPSYGGGLRICAGADPTDGELDVVVVGAVSRFDLARIYPSVPRGGHLSHPAVSRVRARSVRAECPGIVGYADGERLAALPINCAVAPGALRLLSA